MRLIDADALKDYLKSLRHESKRFDDRGFTFVMCMLTENVCKDIDRQPTIEERKWIPCCERLPEDLEEVNVTWVNHSPEPYYDFVKDKPFTASAVYYGGKWYWYSSVCADILAEYGNNDTDEIDGAIEITAWMPLPEPYKGEQE